jgi:protein-L-isoaspartate O-methyltransferase
MNVPKKYIPAPLDHLQNSRDVEHYVDALTLMIDHKYHSILDIGSFDGWMSIMLSEDLYDVTCIEKDSDLTDATKRYITKYLCRNLKVVTGDFLNVNITDTFDLVVCYEVMHMVAWDQLDLWLDKMESLGKTMAISLPNKADAKFKWKPTPELLNSLFQDKKNFRMNYLEYPQNNIPGNWFVSWDV